MADYKFETDQFGITENKIYLLRSRFNYETIDFGVVDKIVIANGRQVNNWVVIFLMGLLLVGFGLFTAIKVIYEFFFANNFTHFYMEQFLIPVLPLFVGVFSLYFSLKIAPVVTIVFNNRAKRLPIEQLKKLNKLSEFIEFLEKNDLTRNKLEIKLAN